jgi:hypothetical protein
VALRKSGQVISHGGNRQNSIEVNGTRLLYQLNCNNSR